MKKIHIDIETFSPVSIADCGVYKYCESEDFEILMVAYQYPEDEEPSIVDLTKDELPKKLVSDMLSGEYVLCAHNAAFERTAFRRIGVQTRPEQWECSMIKAAYCGLPLSLGMVSSALKLGDKAKDSAGKSLIRYFCIPCRPTKVNGGRTRNLPEHDEDKWEEFKNYCKQDVVAEKAIMDYLKKYTIPQEEKEIYALDQRINDRGQKVDIELATNAIRIQDTVKDNLVEEMKQITGVENPNSTAQLKEWVESQIGKQITSLAKDEIPNLINTCENDAVRVILELRQKISITSVKKYNKIIGAACEDGRLRGLFQFYGANRTGRWAGRLVQPQNLPRGKSKLAQVEIARELVKSNDLDTLSLCFGDILQELSGLIRTSMVAERGHKLLVSDFSAIEARVLAWVTGEQWRIDVFNSHGKIYEASASAIFKVPLEEVTKELRQKGKVAELALGYQGGHGAVKRFGGEAMGMTETEMKKLVEVWRSQNVNVTRFWEVLGEAAIRCVAQKESGVENPEIKLKNFKGIAFRCDDKAMTIELPSGRKLFYWGPKLIEGRFGATQVSYYDLDQMTRKWARVDTYGGKLCENITQAIARDILVYSMINADKEGFPINMHVHDEIVVEIPENGKFMEHRADGGLQAADALDFLELLMAETPKWAEGLPLNAEGFATDFYRKD